MSDQVGNQNVGFLMTRLNYCLFSLFSGYYCTIGVNVATPNISFTGDGGICPVAHFCIAESVSPDACTAGTYQDQEGQDSCKTCPEGYFCLATADDFTQNICPEGKLD